MNVFWLIINNEKDSSRSEYIFLFYQFKFARNVSVLEKIG